MTLRRLVTAAALVLATACGERGEPVVEAGGHAGFDCTACHAGAAAGDVVAPVSAGSCAACHDPAGLAATVELANVSFPHAHPGPDGIAQAGCVACHTHAAGEAPLAVGSSTCFLCHADPAPPDVTPAIASLPAERCAECHVQPEHTAFAQSGEPVDHATVLARGVSCLLCHYDVVEGSGQVGPATCRACHGRLGGPDPVDIAASLTDAQHLHTAHLEGGVRLGCARCHEPVEHGVVKLASALVLDCGTCHAPGDDALRPPVDSAAHRPAQMLYAGLAPDHPDITPTRKFLERVSCDACHDVASTRATGPAAQAAINDTCGDCHGPRFASLLGPWLAGMDAHSEAVSEFVRAAAPTRAGGADSLHSAAMDALRLVDAGHGVHNLAGADSLLRTALAAAGRAWRASGRTPPPPPDIGPSPARESCVRCHYGIDTDPAAAADVPFAHGRHILDADLACAECHGSADFFREDGRTFDPAHGSLTVRPVECAVCHHVDTTRECAACHAPAEVAALVLRRDITVNVAHGDVRNTRAAPFDHGAHGAVECARCHTAAAPARPAIDCAECHADHHVEVASPGGCAQCHGASLRAEHERVDHLSCGACHAPATLRLLGSADRAFCLQCHAGQVDHQPAGQCSQCHMQLTPEAAMRTIVSATTPPRGRDGRHP